MACISFIGVKIAMVADIMMDVLNYKDTFIISTIVPPAHLQVLLCDNIIGTKPSLVLSRTVYLKELLYKGVTIDRVGGRERRSESWLPHAAITFSWPNLFTLIEFFIPVVSVFQVVQCFHTSLHIWHEALQLQLTATTSRWMEGGSPIHSSPK